MRIVFMGTPDFSVTVLKALADAGHEIAAVYTRAPKPGGRRGLDLILSPAHVFAQSRALPALTPGTLRQDTAAETFAAHRADAAVVVAYGLILPAAILAIPRRGCLNLHASLLPRWRGAAPIQRAVMAGDAETGVMLMRMEEGLDTGPVALTRVRAITPQTTSGDLHVSLAADAASLAVEGLARLARGALTFTAQSGTGVTYAKKIEKAECRIDWSRPAAEVRNHIHGLSPFPGAWFEADFGKGAERVKVLRAETALGSGVPGEAIDNSLTIACGTGALRLLEVQRAGKTPMPTEMFLRGTAIAPGFRVS